MLRVSMVCGIVVRDISVNFMGGDNFKPLFYHKAGERLMIKCTGILMMMLDF
jgi:hypothetical protein